MSLGKQTKELILIPTIHEKIVCASLDNLTTMTYNNNGLQTPWIWWIQYVLVYYNQMSHLHGHIECVTLDNISVLICSHRDYSHVLYPKGNMLYSHGWVWIFTSPSWICRFCHFRSHHNADWYLHISQLYFDYLVLICLCCSKLFSNINL